jgi:hypothetical protein
MRYLILLLFPVLASAQPPTHCIGGFCECFDSHENGYICAMPDPPSQQVLTLAAPEISSSGAAGALTFLAFSAALRGRKSRQPPRRQAPLPSDSPGEH